MSSRRNGADEVVAQAAKTNAPASLGKAMSAVGAGAVAVVAGFAGRSSLLGRISGVVMAVPPIR